VKIEFILQPDREVMLITSDRTWSRADTFEEARAKLKKLGTTISSKTACIVYEVAPGSSLDDCGFFIHHPAGTPAPRELARLNWKP
jgi:hypothetical protein